MKIDTYTKTVLTVIAVCLVIISIRLTPGAEASRQEPAPVNIVEIGGMRIHGSIPVAVAK